jgi:ABC-type sugar transport system substrate-binding protein
MAARTPSLAVLALTLLSLVPSGAVFAQDKDQAQSLVTALEQTSVYEAPGPAIAVGDALKDKTIYAIVSGLNADFVQQFVAGLNDGAAVLGATVNVQDSAYDSTKAAELIDKAVAGGAVAIVTQSVDSNAVVASITAASAAKVPVVEATSRDAGAVPDDLKAAGLSAISSFCYTCAGQQMAQYAVASSASTVHALIYNVPGVVVSANMVKGFSDELKRLDPSATVTVVDAPAADWEANLATLTTSNLQVNPQINTLVPVFDAMVGLIEPAIAASGLTGVSVVTYNATAPALKLLAAKNLVTGDVGGSPYWLGWATIDQVARLASGGAAVDDVKVPHRLFNSTNIGSIDLSQSQQSWYADVDLKAEYSKLWQVQ